MEGWFEFALERYNYWIVIVLMMTGLYTVFARGNLVKKVVGLNLFQTSVFIFYITIGKIAGGTAPIYIGDELDHGGGDDHGAGDGHGEGAADSLHEAPTHGNDQLTDHGAESAGSLHAKIENDVPSANDLKEALNNLPTDDLVTNGELPASSIHATEDANKILNDAVSAPEKPIGEGFEIDGADLHGAETANAISDAVHHASDIVYTNPLPHVLILTAIVVGVATTAVGLALAVRIREAYGTIEEDELEAIDHVAEFGEPEGAAA